MSFSFLDIDASNQVEEKKAARHAAILANTRVASSFDAFLDASSSYEEREHRMAYIESDVKTVIAAVCEETGHVDVEGLTSAILDRLSKGAFCDDCRKWGDKCECSKSDSDGPKDDDDSEVAKDLDLKPGDEDSKESSFRVAADGKCKVCGKDSKSDVCEQCENDGNPAPGDHNPDRLGKTARRPKLCPYHSELTDASLTAGEPQYAAFASLVGTPSHCKGGYEGSCNFKPAMVTQAYWDQRKEQYEQNRLERERKLNEPDMTLEQVGPTEIVDAPAEVMEDVSDSGINGDLAEAPSAVGSPEPVMAATTDTGDSVEKRETLEKAEGPVPKIDKTKWKPNALNEKGNLPNIDPDSKVHPTVDQDIQDSPDHKKDPLEQANSLTEREDVTQGTEDGRNIDQPHTDTWTGTDGQANPVTSNSIRDFFSQGFTPRDEALKAIAEYEAAQGA